MLSKIISFSIQNKFIVFLFTSFVVGFGIYSLTQIPIGAVPDVTNNQVQVITTSQNLSTQDIEQFITYPVELEMSNLPGVVEIRSTSKFGLSVVTIVFEESMGTYLPRQLISEKLISVRENIPEGFGTPEMGPITTGLGEIYQYILDVEEGYEDQYNATNLRTIQDWIVKRQLSGVKGVVEVSTWGGFLKQYEVAINSANLNAMNITVADIFTALEKNNSVAGGGYIEKTNQSYFIRGEGVLTSLEDIENTLVLNREGLPILVKDVAQVGFGSAMRFGAITANGEGEKVMGQVMMLKGGNSKKVIKSVKERVKFIEKSLPEGVYINGFLDRSELIERTTFTIYENLILGILIVIFVVVLLLGNWRSSLVISSIIPLSLLFTLGLMNIFGVDANLMSLGAIDFGIIIDGAVIIVEFVAFKITSQKTDFLALNKLQAQEKRDSLTAVATTKMVHSAIFGQLIILIVFIPILTLGGVEGKMFKPMALTFSFAIIGALIFGLTFIPAFSSLIIVPDKQSEKNLSNRLMQFFTKLYEPTIRWGLKAKTFILAVSVVGLISTGILFSTMGAEFMPTLDEGDFVIQPSLKTGTSLKKTVETTTKIEKILKDNFPEVNQIVSRIGAAEVPTDPMSMEESDVIITLKPKSEWRSASTKDELANKFKEALAIIPNMEVEFTQPIEMRFNELISGVQSDIAVKIYGDDLDLLNIKANEVKNAIKGIEGAADISVEKTAGLPQMNVNFDRIKIARYNLNIEDLNEIVKMGFAGRTVGSIYEGEKKFDLVVRLHKSKRQDISDLKNLYVDLEDGGKIPLRELADITYKKGAAKISRDDTKRRVVVGINVRDRDLQSVVDDIKQVIEADVEIPVGYNVTYGGQFENLESAKQRLLFAVPIALLLIFVMLYFAFKSVKEALLIFTAIPFAAVGGVLFLWLRGLPFSISAGIGFIALFGVAVLNGIVLIEEFKELKRNGMKNDDELIIFGTKSRLRAVLLTALSTALGFFPMALSQGAGAEVQKPLATVVIGGLITSTLLTLLVLPILYSVFDKSRNKLKGNKAVLTLLLVLVSLGLNAQSASLSLDDLKQLAYDNNISLKIQQLQSDKATQNASAASDVSKTQFSYNYFNDKITEDFGFFNTFGVSQNFDLPWVYAANKNYRKSKVDISKSVYDISKRKIDKEITAAYYNYIFQMEKGNVLYVLDSLYTNFVSKADRRFELGATNYLEKITANTKSKQILLKYIQAQSDVDLALLKIQKIIQKDINEIELVALKKIEVQSDDSENDIGFEYFKAQNKMLNAKSKFVKKEFLPSFNLAYNYGFNTELKGSAHGFLLAMNVSIFSGAIKSRVQETKIEQQIVEEQTRNYRSMLSYSQKELMSILVKKEAQLNYYETEGKQLSATILRTANSSFKNGEIDFFQYIQSIETAYELRLQHIENLNEYNQTIIQLNNLTL